MHVRQIIHKQNTALHWACFYRNNKLIQQLLDSGALADVKNKDGDTPIDLYNKNVDETFKIDVGPGEQGIFSYIPRISEQKLTYMYTQNEKKYSWIDILFHMDKIAFHLMNVSLKQLNQEIVTVKSQLGETPLCDDNKVFEIYTFYNFINKVRNQIEIDHTLVDKLSGDRPNLEVSPICTCCGGLVSPSRSIHQDKSDLQRFYPFFVF